MDAADGGQLEVAVFVRPGAYLTVGDPCVFRQVDVRSGAVCVHIECGGRYRAEYRHVPELLTVRDRQFDDVLFREGIGQGVEHLAGVDHTVRRRPGGDSGAVRKNYVQRIDLVRADVICHHYAAIAALAEDGNVTVVGEDALGGIQLIPVRVAYRHDQLVVFLSKGGFYLVEGTVHHRAAAGLAGKAQVNGAVYVVHKVGVEHVARTAPGAQLILHAVREHAVGLALFAYGAGEAQAVAEVIGVGAGSKLDKPAVRGLVLIRARLVREERDVVDGKLFACPAGVKADITHRSVPLGGVVAVCLGEVEDVFTPFAVVIEEDPRPSLSEIGVVDAGVHTHIRRFRVQVLYADLHIADIVYAL